MNPVIVIISGLAGSGKTVALRALEDEGFFCVDNLPVTLIEAFLSITASGNFNTKIGMGIDIREKEFLPAFDSVIRKLKEQYRIEIIFLESEKNSLIRRFRETRRPHPLVSGIMDIEKAIDIEKNMLHPVRSDADRIVDTSAYTPHQLRHLISSFYRNYLPNAEMTVTLISFGYKFGVPQNIDLLFDVRFIPNPHFIPSLREFNGTEAPVRQFIFEKPAANEFLAKAADLLNFLIPQYMCEGKTYLTIGIGCTGGKHRSPAIAEKIASSIKKPSFEINVVHRDIAE